MLKVSGFFFVDSDDSLPETSLESLFCMCSDADIIVGDIFNGGGG